MPVNTKVLKRGKVCEILIREDDLYAVHKYEGGTVLLSTYEEAEDLMNKVEEKGE